MCLQAAVHNDQLSVLIPPTRADILHKCDIMEDVAIAYGYNNICKTYPRTCTIGQQLPVNKLTDLLRLECAMAGFTEVLTSSLISHDEYFKYLLKADSGEVTVKVDKPAASVFQIIRPSLVPGILKAVSANKFHAKPIMLFEISDVVVKNETSEIGCSNRRHLCLIHFGTLSGLELIQGMLDRVMAMLKFPQTTVDPRSGYYVSEYEESFLLPGRSARVYVGGEHMGCLGNPLTVYLLLANPICRHRTSGGAGLLRAYLPMRPIGAGYTTI
jgi:phenylalanyl-tRNA synthetase beta chain